MASMYLASLIVLAYVSLQCGVNGDGSIKIRFLRYTNPGGLGDNGHCCDGKFGFCQRNGCDHKFTICLHSQSYEGALNTAECDYGLMQSGETKNQDDIQFGSVFGSVDNPMSFGVQGQLPSGFQLLLDVWDRDGLFSNDFVEFLRNDISFPDNPKERFPVVLKGRTKLEAEVWIECAASYYGRLCGAFCQTPGSDDNYVCDENTGEKMCKEGWTGSNCVDRVTPTTTTPTTGLFDCDAWARRGDAYQTGVYGISVPGIPKFSAWCDMDSNGEGWIIIQRRNGDNEVLTNFNRNWEAYKRGFGNLGPKYEFWLGLEKVHLLTTKKRFALHIKMQIGNGEWRWARYDRFWVDSEAEGYSLHVEGYSGDAGDALTYLGMDGTRNHNGQAFSTFDKDADGWQDGSCAQIYKSGWWFNDCAWANLNGVYSRPEDGWPVCSASSCLGWRTIEGYEFYSLLATEMRIRPNPRDQ